MNALDDDGSNRETIGEGPVLRKLHGNFRSIMGVKRADKRTDEIRVEVGVKESLKTKWEMRNWQREQMPRTWRGKGGEEDRHCDGVALKMT